MPEPAAAVAKTRDAAPVAAETDPPTESSRGALPEALPEHNVLVLSENLAALKLLRPAYRRRVKLIYIDPPYNTGKADFIYADDFGRVGGGGEVLATAKPRRRDAAPGASSAGWLSMMYPRLALARDFLADDGVLCVSIDDHEVHHLRCLLDELFGAGNFEGHLHWRRRHNQPNDRTKLIGLVAEHILVYARDASALKASGVGKLPLTGKFSNPDGDPRGPWASKPWKVGSDQSGSAYAITSPAGERFEAVWMGERATYEALLADGRIVFPRGGRGLPRKKYFRAEREAEGQCASNWWDHELAGSNQEGNRELAALFDGVKNVFSNPKPTRLIRLLMRLANVRDGDVVMDFFAGSGSTGDAVLQARAEGLDARFLLVQADQPIEGRNKYRRAAEAVLAPLGRPVTIGELTRERLSRALRREGAGTAPPGPRSVGGAAGFLTLRYAAVAKTSDPDAESPAR